ncbi:MAG: Maf-like protein [Spirochaetia bacterium]|nr:Maf-like protein [Spirochaetia bacterium]
MFLIFRNQPQALLEWTPEEKQHVRARRLRPGDPIFCGDGRSRRYPGIVSDTAGANAGAAIDLLTFEERIESRRVLLCAVPEGPRRDWLLQKSTELGLTDIVPVAFEHSERNDFGKRADRIVTEAAAQSRRFTLPVIHPGVTLAKAIEWGLEQSLSPVVLDPTAAEILVPPERPANSNSTRAICFVVGNRDCSNRRACTEPFMKQLILASASPARRRLLESAGFNPIILAGDFDESSILEKNPEQLVRILAQKKAENVISKLQSKLQSNEKLLSATNPDEKMLDATYDSSIRSGDAFLLGCDSVLALRGEIHGKPQDASDAINRWKMMRGQTGELWTGHALYLLRMSPDGCEILKSIVRAPCTKVRFANPDDQEIESYVRTGEPLQCAGAFALEGRGGLFVAGLDGCHSNVIGLSLPVFREMLIEAGSGVF